MSPRSAVGPPIATWRRHGGQRIVGKRLLDSLSSWRRQMLTSAGGNGQARSEGHDRLHAPLDALN